MSVERTVTVTGQGSTAVVPDVAELSLAAAVSAGTVGDAFRGTSAAVEALLETARAAVPEAGVRSQGINLWTETDREGRASGFRCSHGVRVTCPSLDLASTLLGALVEAVGDRLQIEGVSMQVADSSAAYAAAREAAYADAVERATALASLAGATLGEALTVAEGGAGGFRGRAPLEMMASMPIAAGEQSVDATVTVTFALT